MSSEKSSSHVAKSSVTFGTGEFVEKPQKNFNTKAVQAFEKCGITWGCFERVKNMLDGTV